MSLHALLRVSPMPLIAYCTTCFTLPRSRTVRIVAAIIQGQGFASAHRLSCRAVAHVLSGFPPCAYRGGHRPWEPSLSSSLAR